MFASSPIKLLYSDAHTSKQLSNYILSLIHHMVGNRPIVICCVGTDRSTGDSLGPLVGSRLSKYNIPGFNIYGTLDDPVHAMNLSDKIAEIHNHFTNPYIIAVDASLGQMSSIGHIQVGDGPLKPGSGVNKELPPIGNIHITGIVNVSGFMEYFVLQNTRLSIVMNMAEVISDSIYHSLQTLYLLRTTSAAGK
jgi:putative sporulation protein YyaC